MSSQTAAIQGHPSQTKEDDMLTKLSTRYRLIACLAITLLAALPAEVLAHPPDPC
jgi:hypothetical protein